MIKWVKDNDLTSSDGFHYGYGLFETILVKNNNASNLAQHLNRLKIALMFSQVKLCRLMKNQYLLVLVNYQLWLCVLKILLYKDKLCFKTKIFHRQYLYSMEVAKWLFLNESNNNKK